MKNNEILKKYLSLLPSFNKSEKEIKNFLDFYVLPIRIDTIQFFIFLDSKNFNEKSHIMYTDNLNKDLEYTMLSLSIKDMNTFLIDKDFRIKIEKSKKFENIKTQVCVD